MDKATTTKWTKNPYGSQYKTVAAGKRWEIYQRYRHGRWCLMEDGTEILNFRTLKAAKFGAEGQIMDVQRHVDVMTNLKGGDNDQG